MMPSDATDTGALDRGAMSAARRAAARRRGAAGSFRHIRAARKSVRPSNLREPPREPGYDGAIIANGSVKLRADVGVLGQWAGS